MAKQSILEILSNVTDTDLDEIIERRKVLQREDEALAVLEKAINLKLHGKPERAKPGPKQKIGDGGGSVTMEYRRKAAGELLRNGPLKPMLLASAARIPSGSITGVIDHPWFEHNGDGGNVSLSAQGKRENG